MRATTRKRGPAKAIGAKTAEVTVDLTSMEWADRAKRLAEVHGEIDAHTQHESNAKAALKARRAALEAEQSLLAMAVSTRRESRTVPVRVEIDEVTLLVYEIREDTGEVINERPATEAERQLQLEGFHDA